MKSFAEKWADICAEVDSLKSENAALKSELAQQHLTQQGRLEDSSQILRDCLNCGSFESDNCDGNVGLTGCEQWRKTSALL